MDRFTSILFSKEHLIHPFTHETEDHRTISIGPKKQGEFIAWSVVVGIFTAGIGGLVTFYALTAKYKADQIKLLPVKDLNLDSPEEKTHRLSKRITNTGSEVTPKKTTDSNRLVKKETDKQASEKTETEDTSSIDELKIPQNEADTLLSHLSKLSQNEVIEDPFSQHLKYLEETSVQNYSIHREPEEQPRLENSRVMISRSSSHSQIVVPEEPIYDVVNEVIESSVVESKIFDDSSLKIIQELTDLNAQMSTVARLQMKRQKIVESLYADSNGVICGIYPPTKGMVQKGLQALHFRQYAQREDNGNLAVRLIVKAEERIDAINTADYSQPEMVHSGKIISSYLTSMKSYLQQEAWTKLSSMHRERLIKKLNTKISELNPPNAQVSIEELSGGQFEKQFNGQIVNLFREMLDPSAQFEANDCEIYPAHLVNAKLKSLYGPEICSFVENHYQLADKIYFSSREIQALLVGISANLTLPEVQYIIANKEFGEIAPHLKVTIEQAFGELNDSTLCALLKGLRNIHLPPDELFPSKVRDQTTPVVYTRALRTETLDQYAADVQRMKACKALDEYDSTHHGNNLDLMLGPEYLARWISYALYFVPDLSLQVQAPPFREGILFPVFDASRPEGKQLTCKRIETLVAKDALYCSIAYPALLDQEPESAIAIDVMARGTSDNEAWCRDFSMKQRSTPYRNGAEGPGRKVFETHQKELTAAIIAKMEFISSQTGKSLIYRGCGHSLGASDAQRTLQAFLRAFVEKKEKNEESFSLAGMKLDAFCPPRVEFDVNATFMADLLKVPEIKCDLFYLKGEGDVVPLTGQCLLGAPSTVGMPQPANLLYSVLKFLLGPKGQRGVIYRANAHMLSMFSKDAERELMDIRTIDPRMEGIETHPSPGKVLKSSLKPNRAGNALVQATMIPPTEKDDPALVKPTYRPIS